jgi:hypothetical protein
MGSATVAHHRVPRHLRDLEAWFNGTMQALAKAGIFGAQVMGMVDATALETTAAYAGCGPGTRRRQSTDQQGHVRALEVTVYGGKPLVVIAALTTMPLAVQVVPIHEPAGRSRRALGTPARTHLAGCARWHTVVCARGVWAGAERWWLDRHGLTGVVPAHANMAVTVEARAPAAVGEGLTMGRRVQTVRHGPGQTAWTARRETEVGGITGLTTDAPSGTPEHRRHHTRRGGAPNPIPAVVVRPGNGHEDGPGGQPGFLTHAAVPQPLKPCEDADDRRRLEHGCIKAATPPWDLGHAPQKTGRAVRGQVVFPCLRLARATAYRLPCEPAEVRAEPVGWQRGRRQLLAQTRDKVIVFTEGW